ncbi:MAG TPA: alpha/beta hydrolase [Thermoanaerobaculia bacterium]|nr:alpha/beta hydrolase [Thermoanaerobaculia bacterium]
MRTSLAVGVFLLAVVARAAELTDYVGNYAIEGRTLAIAEFEVDPEAPRVLAFTDFASGRFGVLTEVAPDTYALHERVMSGSEAARIRFIRAGRRVTALTFQPHGKRQRLAKRVPHRRIELTIPSGAATLLIPAGRAPFPAVVIVPAGRVGRTAAATFPNFFLSQGFAVLAYDRRKESAPFDTYAADAVAAAEALRRRPDIDPRRIGLWGHSQGGWLSVIAASKSASVAFVIDHSGMFVPAWQQELYRLGAEGAADGKPAADVAAAVAYEAKMTDVARSGEGWNDLMSAWQSGKGKWEDLVYKPASLEELQRIWRDDFSFDPRPLVANVRQPVLALFGGLDRSTPIESAANLKRAMPANTCLTEMVFPTADHAFLDAVTGGNREIPNLSRFVPGMFDAMRTWLRRYTARMASFRISRCVK